MKQNWPLYSYAAILCGMVAIAVTGTHHWPKLPHVESMEAAAWTQAIGSVLAILVSALIAIYIPRHHENLALRNRQALGVRLSLDLSSEIIRFLESAKHFATTGAVNPGTFPHITTAVRAALAELDKLSLTDVPGSFRLRMIALRTDINLVLVFLDQAHQTFSAGSPVSGSFFDSPIGSTRKNRDKILEYVRSHPIGQNPIVGHT